MSRFLCAYSYRLDVVYRSECVATSSSFVDFGKQMLKLPSTRRRSGDGACRNTSGDYIQDPRSARNRSRETHPAQTVAPRQDCRI
ncbi:uncharacterized protein Dyak_GE28890 [Drosophila yakuba]|uniref:Uncharacterized protein n=1 Tax=Drosophila yakuba TaxID=7245 RepID=A0A0R1E882_DROYA|nr:uncharacterized protein Dyak_GE28890 [Drosophila yakuba]